MDKLSLINLMIIGLSLVVFQSVSCDKYEIVYVNPIRPFSVVYGTFRSNNLPESDKLGDLIVDCEIINHPRAVDTIKANDQLVNLMATIGNVELYDSLAKYCSSSDLSPVKSLSQSPVFKLKTVPKFGFKPSLILPGTKWCGAGNVADNYDHLGENAGLDACCREHDHCPVNIKAGRKHHNIVNNSPYTASHCDCDDKFKVCLKETGNMQANMVGVMYFNMLQTKCFREKDAEAEEKVFDFELKPF